MARILVLNGQDLSVVWNRVAAGSAPDHLLYGLNHFERCGHSVQIVPYQRSRMLTLASRALRRSPIPLGDLDQQVAVLRAARGADLVYCPCQNVAQLLGYLRTARAFDRPIVWVVHHPLDRGRLSAQRRPLMRAMLRGVDAYPALSGPVAEDLAGVAGSAERTSVLAWGPDPNWYPSASGPGSGVIAAGIANRDFDTFARAISRTDVSGWIVCPESAAPRTPPGPRVQLITRSLPHRELAELYAQVRAIAIPLRVGWPWPMNGLQCLLDAIGVGKPVIATRNPWIDIDIERLGIGIWVAPGDVNGWRAAIRHLDEHPDVAVEMGARARALVESAARTSTTFADQVMSVFDHVLSGASHAPERGA